VGKLWCSYNQANMHYSGDREAMTYDGTGGPSYFGPVARSAAGSTHLTLPANRPGGGGDVVLVVNGTGAGQRHAILSFDSESRTYELATPLVVELSPDSWIQAMRYQGGSMFVGNRFVSAAQTELSTSWRARLTISQHFCLRFSLRISNATALDADRQRSISTVG
jgi:hypothetical protein